MKQLLPRSGWPSGSLGSLWGGGANGVSPEVMPLLKRRLDGAVSLAQVLGLEGSEETQMCAGGGWRMGGQGEVGFGGGPDGQQA